MAQVILGKSSNPVVVPVVTAGSAYTAGNVVGGKLIFRNAVDSQAKSGLLQAIRMVVKSIQTAGFKLAVFKGEPTNTPWADKVAPSLNSGDSSTLIGVFDLGSPEVSLGGTTSIYRTDNLAVPILLPGVDLYGVLLTTGTPTFTASDDIVELGLAVIKD
jgi:hypothetical protein